MFNTMNEKELQMVDGGVKAIPYYYGRSIVKWSYVADTCPYDGYVYDERFCRYEPYYGECNLSTDVARYFY